MRMASFASNSLPSGRALPLAAEFVVMGYGMVLSVLPGLLMRILGTAANEAVAWHAGLLTGV
jgi:hypothetical protein